MGVMRKWTIVGTLLSQVRLTARLLRDPAVPALVKGLPLLALVYLLFPFDFVPDVIPILGQVDDAGVMLVALGAFVALCPDGVVAFHRAALSGGRRYAPMPPASAPGEVIDAEFRHDNPER